MTIEESIRRINQLQRQLSRTLEPFQTQISQAMTPIQDHISQAIAPVIEQQQRIRESILPVMQQQCQIKESLVPIINHLNSIPLNPAIQAFISSQQDILNSISTLDFDISSSHISTEASVEFSQIVSDVLDELNDMEIDELIDSNQEISTCTSSKTTLTWEQILFIIGFLLDLLAITLSQMPNPQLTNIEKGIYQIIEIERQQLNLLEELINE